MSVSSRRSFRASCEERGRNGCAQEGHCYQCGPHPRIPCPRRVRRRSQKTKHEREGRREPEGEGKPDPYPTGSSDARSDHRHESKPEPVSDQHIPSGVVGAAIVTGETLVRRNRAGESRRPTHGRRHRNAHAGATGSQQKKPGILVRRAGDWRRGRARPTGGPVPSRLAGSWSIRACPRSPPPCHPVDRVCRKPTRPRRHDARTSPRRAAGTALFVHLPGRGHERDRWHLRTSHPSDGNRHAHAPGHGCPRQPDGGAHGARKQ